MDICAFYSNSIPQYPADFNIKIQQFSGKCIRFCRDFDWIIDEWSEQSLW